MSTKAKAGFALNRTLPRNAFAEERPTVVAILRNVAGEVMLVHPQKIDIAANAWMFPQGPIAPLHTPYQALDSLLQDECGMSVDDLESGSIQLLMTDLAQTKAGLKRYYCLFATIKAEARPRLTKQVKKSTRNLFFTGDPNCVWQKIVDDTPKKRHMIARALALAVQRQLLVTEKWQLANMYPMLRNVVA